jgi:sec-independent protein translocase protein TatC
MATKKAPAKEMSFLDHLEELRWRILKAIIAVVVGAIVCFAFSGRILDFLTLPVHRIEPQPKLIFLSPTGMFMVRITLSLACGFILALPVVVYQIYAFIVPGLYTHERRHVVPLIVLTFFCFLLGSSFAYFLIIPFGLRFLLGLATPDIQPTLDIGRYIDFVTRLMLAFGLVFEMPVLAMFLTRIGLLNPRFLRRIRRYAIVIIAIVSAILTPPDAFTQIMMIIPLVALYEISILLSTMIYRRKKEREAKEEEEWEKDDSEDTKRDGDDDDEDEEDDGN